MPYKKRAQQFEEFVMLLKGHDLNATQLAKVLGCSFPTAKAKLDDPERFTFGDILKIQNKGHIGKEELKGAITWH